MYAQLDAIHRLQIAVLTVWVLFSGVFLAVIKRDLDKMPTVAGMPEIRQDVKTLATLNVLTAVLLAVYLVVF